MHIKDLGGPPTLGRRELLAGAGTAAVAATVGALGVPDTAEASGRPPRHHHHHHVNPIPSPIPFTLPTGLPPEHPLAMIHWALPSPDGVVTPILGLGGFGLDADPSTIGDYWGFTAYAVIAGSAKGSDGETYDCEFDVRVMDGIYKAANGTWNRGTYGFF